MPLTVISKIDKYLSTHLSFCATEQSKYGHLRWFMKALEFIGHETLWFPLVTMMIGVAIYAEPGSIMRNNLPLFLAIFLGLVAELLSVIVIKLVTKRHRPETNHMDMHSPAPSIDVYSFPSGHTSRITMLAFLTCTIFENFFFTHHYHWPLVVLFAFVFLLASSRVFLGRHFPSDLVGGFILGYFMANVTLTIFLPFVEKQTFPIDFDSWKGSSAVRTFIGLTGSN